MALVAGTVSTPPSANAGGMIKADEDKWISIGMGIRTSFNAREGVGGGSGSQDGGYDQSFAVDNARIYINGQIHKYVKFNFNTECFSCGGGGGLFAPGVTANAPAPIIGQAGAGIGLIDAIGKFEFDEKLNIWAGRMLLPFDRGELNGPFYHATYYGFRTPFLISDHGNGYNSNANGGLFGRDNGVTLWGKVHPFGTHLLYAFMFSTGTTGGPNLGQTPTFTGRLNWNLLNDESDNPGYYTAGTYYGGYGDLLTLAAGFNHQHNGVGTGAFKTDMNAVVFDLLFEKLIPNNMGVFTFNAEFKRYWGDQIKAYTTPNPGCTTSAPGQPGGGGVSGGFGCQTGIFRGHSWTVYALYLIPTKIGIGRFQPYGRFTSIDPIDSTLRQEWEAGMNYVIDGHNARISAFWTYGDINTKGFFNYAPGAAGNRQDAFHVALQLQY
ncbi:MAG: hypothetical protein HP492_07060 [Nitrospira sp.]|nr:hypothetical protein [Nitrospira sp.]